MKQNRSGDLINGTGTHSDFQSLREELQLMAAGLYCTISPSYYTEHHRVLPSLLAADQSNDYFANQ